MSGIESVQHWTPEDPCIHCMADSNTNHFPTCPNAGLYDHDGDAIPCRPAARDPK